MTNSRLYHHVNVDLENLSPIHRRSSTWHNHSTHPALKIPLQTKKSLSLTSKTIIWLIIPRPWSRKSIVCLTIYVNGACGFSGLPKSPWRNSRRISTSSSSTAVSGSTALASNSYTVSSLDVNLVALCLLNSLGTLSNGCVNGIGEFEKQLRHPFDYRKKQLIWASGNVNGLVFVKDRRMQ